MLGAIIGDTIGSVYEFCNIKSTNFPLFSEGSGPTDDSVMSIAVAEWLLTDPERSQQKLEECMVKWGHKYPRAGYGGNFLAWLFNPNYATGFYEERRMPYHSWGNGSAMRCSACGWVAKSAADALDLATRSAMITHNHPEGIRGAQATALAIWMARHDSGKEAIRYEMENYLGYDLSRDCDDIRPRYGFDVSCQGTMPAAFAAFFDSYDYESAVRLAVSLGGDSDTIACITGGIAEAFYGEIPEPIVTEARKHIPEEFWSIIDAVQGK